MPRNTPRGFARLACSLLGALTTTTGAAAQEAMAPLIDLGAGLYKGFEGGLYPGAANETPTTHRESITDVAAQIVPRGADGQPDGAGLIGLISIGMSNTNQEFGAFAFLADADTRRNARLVIVDAAQGGQDSTTIANPAAPYWNGVAGKVAAAGLTPEQVQVVWLKEAKAQPTGAFPAHAESLRDELAQIARNLREQFPNLQICYLSSRIYAGYATGTLNPEPFAYESGFSVKWLIEDQISGDPGLNWDPQAGPVVAPLLLWGPYLWADGASPNSQGTFWLPEDFEQGGTNAHPSEAGERKVADLLMEFFSGDPSARPWWPKRASERLVALDATADAFVRAGAPNENFGALTQLEVAGGQQPTITHLRFDATGVDSPVQYAKLGLRVDPVATGGAVGVAPVNDNAWSEATITFNSAPAPGQVVVTAPQRHSRGGFVSIDVTALASAGAGAPIAVALLAEPGADAGQRVHLSRESGEPARLTMAVTDTCPADFNGDGAVGGADLGMLLGRWGGAHPTFDLNADGVVDGADLGLTLAAWGPCR